MLQRFHFKTAGEQTAFSTSHSPEPSVNSFHFLKLGFDLRKSEQSSNHATKSSTGTVPT
jgi:hypothetical protein